MRRLSTLLLLLTLLAGCKSTTGPLASKQRDQKPDPLFNIEQQERWSRERFPYYEENRNVAPNTYNYHFQNTPR